MSKKFIGDAIICSILYGVSVAIATLNIPIGVLIGMVFAILLTNIIGSKE